MKKRRKKKESSLLGLFVVFVILGWLIYTGRDTQQTESKDASYTLTAKQLCSEYASNEISADLKYKGKLVIVSGSIDDFGSIFKRPYIILEEKGVFDGVRCIFDKSSESSIASLSKGQQVFIEGEVIGKNWGYVELKNAKLYDPAPF